MLKLHNLFQGSMSVDEYTREFEKLLIKCDIQELQDQTIVGYLGALNPKYFNMVELQQYSAFDEVCLLAHNVEKQRKSKSFQHDFSQSLPFEQTFNKGSSNPPSDPTASLLLHRQKSKPHKSAHLRN